MWGQADRVEVRFRSSKREPTAGRNGDDVLRIEISEQGTLRCDGRTDELCVGEILWVMLDAGYSGSESNSLYACTNPTSTLLTADSILPSSTRSYDKKALMARCP